VAILLSNKQAAVLDQTAQMRQAGEKAAAPHKSNDPTAKAAAAAKAHAAAASRAAAAAAATEKSKRLTAATNAKGDRMDVKEKKKQQRMRGQDAHNGVWKSEQEMQLRCGFD
jgi:hypothetical protein